MRFFIALEIPDENKAELEQIQKKLKVIIPNIRMTDPSKLHLTLAFVGEQPDELKEKLAEVINQASVGVGPFKVTPGYLDGFPNLHNPSTLWVGVKGDVDKLFILRERIKDQLTKLGIDSDLRRFVPHIALGKVRDFHMSVQAELDFEKIDQTNFLPITVSSIKLFESIPGEGFHKHNTLAESVLKSSS